MGHILLPTLNSDFNLSGREVSLCYSQSGCLEGNGSSEKLYYGEYLQWLQPGNIQGVCVCMRLGESGYSNRNIECYCALWHFLPFIWCQVYRE